VSGGKGRKKELKGSRKTLRRGSGHFILEKRVTKKLLKAPVEKGSFDLERQANRLTARSSLGKRELIKKRVR